MFLVIKAFQRKNSPHTMEYRVIGAINAILVPSIFVKELGSFQGLFSRLNSIVGKLSPFGIRHITALLRCGCSNNMAAHFDNSENLQKE